MRTKFDLQGTRTPLLESNQNSAGRTKSGEGGACFFDPRNRSQKTLLFVTTFRTGKQA